MKLTTSLCSVIQQCQVHQIFFMYFTVILKKKIILDRININSKKKEMFICEISIIIILICQKLGSVGPVQQKIKLPLPNSHWAIKPLRHYCFQLFFCFFLFCFFSCWQKSKKNRAMKNCLVELSLFAAPFFTIIIALYARSAIKRMQQRKQVWRQKSKF